MDGVFPAAVYFRSTSLTRSADRLLGELDFLLNISCYMLLLELLYQAGLFASRLHFRIRCGDLCLDIYGMFRNYSSRLFLGFSSIERLDELANLGRFRFYVAFDRQTGCHGARLDLDGLQMLLCHFALYPHLR
ncbi:hypothetical protein QLG10_02435 [Pseudomonas sp. V98_8]|jgi:hypothetical protein|nr:hypothetical protein [Pseudomonas sp. V98_8]